MLEGLKRSLAYLSRRSRLVPKRVILRRLFCGPCGDTLSTATTNTVLVLSSFQANYVLCWGTSPHSNRVDFPARSERIKGDTNMTNGIDPGILLLLGVVISGIVIAINGVMEMYGEWIKKIWPKTEKWPK